MSANFFWAIGASVAVSLISLIGVFSLLLKDKLLENLIFVLIGFSAGALIGGSFLHILPETLETNSSDKVFLFVLLGFILFFFLERYFYWRHCHEGVCDIHAFSYLNLIGDGIHNFSDGLAIGSSFIIDIRFGLITTLLVVLHEIPQELGDFGVLVYGGFSKAKALFYNFISALTCIIGTVLGFYLSSVFTHFSQFLLPIVAGGFIYIASCDLIPELHKQPGLKRASLSVTAFSAGILFIYLSRFFHGH